MNKKGEKNNFSHSSIFTKSKRGQGLSVNMIILIVLGVAVLAVLIVGFTVGWSKLNPFLSANNVNTIVTSCKVACETRSLYDFCTAPRELKADDLPGNVKSIKGNCTFFATNADYGKYGINDCSAITCTSSNQ